MASARCNGIRIEYETFGDPTAPAVVLIMGLGAQMIFWEDDFCREIARRGFWVVRFDNRDCGLSTHFPESGVPDVARAVAAALNGEPVEAPYGLADMAADTVGLFDALGIARAHVVGASMGGMIAQHLAFGFPGRVGSLTSIMSTTGDRRLPPGRPDAMAALLAPPPADRAGFVEHMVRTFRILGSPGFEFDEAGFRERVGRAYDRDFDPGGVARQLAAILADGDRTERLRSVRSPTLVIHGREDPLIPIEGGIATARAIPGARFLAIDGMGHDLPRGTWPAIVDGIADIAAAGERAARGG